MLSAVEMGAARANGRRRRVLRRARKGMAAVRGVSITWTGGEGGEREEVKQDDVLTAKKEISRRMRYSKEAHETGQTFWTTSSTI